MKLLKEKFVDPIQLNKGDVISVTYADINTEEPTKVLITHEATENLLIDKIAIYEVQETLGFEQAYQVMLGKSK